MPYKHDYDKTLTRLNTIIARLNDGEELSVKELAEEFNVSIRTVQRDFNEKLVGLYPIYQDKRKWKMQDGYKIEKATSIEDTIVLDILEKMTEGLGTTFSLKAKHLLSKIKNENFNPIYAKINMEDISAYFHYFSLLEKTIEKKKIVSCKYQFTDYEKQIKIKPLKLVNYEGFWYLIALNVMNNKLRKFHLKSISNLKVRSEHFTYKKELDALLENSINVWFDIEVEPFEVILFLDKYAAKTLKRKPISNSQTVISEYKDGSCDVSLKITHEREIISIVQYWMPHIKIISPDWIREKIFENIKRFI